MDPVHQALLLALLAFGLVDAIDSLKRGHYLTAACGGTVIFSLCVALLLWA